MELSEGAVAAPASSGSGLTPDGRRMLQAIGSLPDDEREAFDLVRAQGVTQAEAARVLGVAPVTVKRRLNRGLRLLTEQLVDLRPGEDQRSGVRGQQSGVRGQESGIRGQESGGRDEKPD